MKSGCLIAQSHSLPNEVTSSRVDPVSERVLECLHRLVSKGYSNIQTINSIHLLSEIFEFDLQTQKSGPSIAFISFPNFRGLIFKPTTQKSRASGLSIAFTSFLNSGLWITNQQIRKGKLTPPNNPSNYSNSVLGTFQLAESPYQASLNDNTGASPSLYRVKRPIIAKGLLHLQPLVEIGPLLHGVIYQV